MVGVLRSVWWIRDDRSQSFIVVRSRIPCIGEVIWIRGWIEIERPIIRAKAPRLLIATYNSATHVQNGLVDPCSDKLARLAQKPAWVRAVEFEP
jgi:hypothetical protein